MNTKKNNKLALIVGQGEGQKVEFKEKPNRLDREIVAFANASGGSIFLGVNDSGKISGIRLTNKLKSELHDTARNCDPPIRISIEEHSGQAIEVRVNEGDNKPYRCKDGFFLWIGPNTQKLKRNEIAQIILSEGKHHFDEMLNEDFIFQKDFDKGKLDRFLEIAGIEHHAPHRNILASLDVAQIFPRHIKLRQAGVLFFAKEPQHFLKESHISCVRYSGTDRFDVIDREEIYGDPITMIERALRFAKRNVRVQYSITANAQHQEIYEYPLVAIREAIINAVMHRDYYYDASHIYIHIFSDRLEIENPGGLYHGLKIEDLGKRSVRRNRTIADLLYRAKFVERIGSGIQRMEKALELNNNPPMEITATNFFVVKFFPRIASDRTLSLTTRQNKLYQFIKGKGSVSKTEAAQLLGVSGDTALREIKILMQEVLIQKSGVGKNTVYSLKTD